MKKDNNHNVFFVSILALTLGLFPAVAALANENGSSSSLQGGIKTEIELEGRGNSASVNASTSVKVRGENDSDDRGEDERVSTTSNRGGSATSTENRKDGERRSGQSNDNDNDSDDNKDIDDDGDEIEINHRSALNASTTVDHPDKVKNRGQLRSFLNHIVKGDDRVADVTVSSTTVRTHYSMPAKFLWTIPVSLTAQVSIGSDGSVTVTYPWYAFLFSKKGDELKSQLTAIASSTASTTATTTLSASVQAHLLNLLFSTLKDSSSR